MEGSWLQAYVIGKPRFISNSEYLLYLEVLREGQVGGILTGSPNHSTVIEHQNTQCYFRLLRLV